MFVYFINIILSSILFNFFSRFVIKQIESRDFLLDGRNILGRYVFSYEFKRCIITRLKRSRCVKVPEARFIYHSCKPVCLSFAPPEKSPSETRWRDVIVPISISLSSRSPVSFRGVKKNSHREKVTVLAYPTLSTLAWLKVSKKPLMMRCNVKKCIPST